MRLTRLLQKLRKKREKSLTSFVFVKSYICCRNFLIITNVITHQLLHDWRSLDLLPPGPWIACVKILV